ncbi:MAG: DNA adenine methylase [Candidatus Thiodiazotropha sp. (ex Dulcina madagascariensis)]|nr:DNA adenine methylase [Candidatus Thiodiazotropha sp. (ex Dulcina madagascariensis)]
MSYLGSKGASGAFQAIIAQMPPHDTYIETHLGTGAVMRHKPNANRSIGIDADQATLDKYHQDTAGVELVCKDAVSVLKSFDFDQAGRTLIYADPPYLHETRTSRKRYRHEYNREDHIRLLECLKQLPASVILSGYPSPLYDELLDDWRTLEFQVMTRGGVRTEKLWMNYDSEAAHWASFTGTNFTDRQRIKRKANRWAKNFKRLPPGERLAILAALLEVKGRPA